MAREPFTYPFCYTPAPDIVAAAQRLIAALDGGGILVASDLPGAGLPASAKAGKDLGGCRVPGLQSRQTKSASAGSTSGYSDPREFEGVRLHIHQAITQSALAEGKMLGVLKVEDQTGTISYLYGFSGTAGGLATLPGFVPPIYDLTDPDGYFRRREAEISAMPAGSERKAASAALQAWIFEQYRVSNARGETLTVREVFARRGLTPPGGTGDCAAPKLLQYAYTHGLKPLAMGEFWYGASPAAEVRDHGRFYPSCTGKCGPLLDFMLEGLDVAPNPLDREFTTDAEPRILYEDPVILVVSKPAGMLSVPGRTRAKSLLDWLRERCGEVHSCHRLDMDTSGVMVFARTAAAKAELERQFAEREVGKTYRARLAAADRPFGHARRGTIALPLALDYYDRPRQMVDRAHGKLAVTEFEVLALLPDGEIDIRFTPKTGRTHQLRVHAAHADGLGRPIKGDRLYGSPDGGRLFLHAETLDFRHPATGEPLHFEDRLRTGDHVHF